MLVNKLTSDQWFAYINGQNKHIAIVMEHAGGWNAHNLHYEWYIEKIDRTEFDKRLQGSTIRTERKAALRKKGIKNYEFHA